LGVQLTLPFINRDYRRLHEGAVDSGNENGLGDMSLFSRFTIYERDETENFLIVRALFGVKLPTGDSDLLAEESAPGHHEEEVGGHEDDAEAEHHEDEPSDSDHHHEEMALKHNGVDHGDDLDMPSAIHGHDLALGSGSVDTMYGLSLFYQRRRFFSLAEVQYFIRSEGDYDYRYANDLVFSVGPGVYLFTKKDSALGLRTNFSGEYKEKDVYDGDKQDDTARTNLYVGPELIFTSNNALSITGGVDLPVLRNNSGFQVVPDYRLRLGIGYRF
jgi:hypothetical protein